MVAAQDVLHEMATTDESRADEAFAKEVSLQSQHVGIAHQLTGSLLAR
jgi:hypothetical protein